MRMPTSLKRVAATQDGIVTRAQALADGVTEDAIRWAVSQGTWQRINRGVFATFSWPLQERHRIRAALLHAGKGAVVSGSTACRAYGMRYAPNQLLVILVPHAVKRRRVAGVEFRRTRSTSESRDVRSFPCAAPERAALDACLSTAKLETVQAVLCEVVQRGLCTAEELIVESAASRLSSPGIRKALSDVVAGCRSKPECDCRDLIRTSKVLPEPVWNEELPDVDGAKLIPDGQWKEARLVVEIDSAEWHRFGDKPELTERKRACYASLGWRVMPISPRRLREEPDAVLRELEDAYLAGLGHVSGVGEN